MKLLVRTALLLGTALLSFSATATAQTTHQVLTDGIEFTPNDLTIAEGDTVEWVWVTGVHNVISGDPLTATPDGIFDSGLPVAPPATFSVTFDNAFVTANPVPGGAYEYWCDVHFGFGMVGVVRVAGPVPAFPAWAAVSTGLLVLAGGAFLLRGRTQAVAL